MRKTRSFRNLYILIYYNNIYVCISHRDIHIIRKTIKDVYKRISQIISECISVKFTGIKSVYRILFAHK
jgi:hypothetical protein